MEIDIRREGEVTVAAIEGSVDGMTAEDLTDRLTGRVEVGETRLVADFSGVNYTSSAGLRALLTTLKEARQRGGDIRLAAVRPDVLRVLQLSGFTNILKLYDNVQAAVDSYAR